MSDDWRLIRAVGVMALLVAGCGSSAVSPSVPPTASPALTPSPAPTASPAVAWYQSLPPCPNRPDVHCGTIQVPLDHAVPADREFTLAYRVYPHLDTTQPPLESVVSLPGGPGISAAWQEDILAANWIRKRHDVIAVDRRGTGGSSPIDCPDLQDGFSSLDELKTAVGACATQLGDTADRYGSGDAALDVESLREALGFGSISLFGFSYGTVIAQAYAARFPERVHAMIIDSGLRPGDPDHIWSWDLGRPGAQVAAIADECAASAGCRSTYPDVADLVDRAFARAKESPFGEPSAGKRVGEVELGVLLGTVGDGGGVGPIAFLSALTKALADSPDDLIALTEGLSPFPGVQHEDLATYSAGLNFAAWCTDDATAWDRSDPIATRRAKLAAAIDALPDDSFAPMSVEGWLVILWPEACLGWPAPDHFEPVTPPDARPIGVPTLVLIGTRDMAVMPYLGEAVAMAIPGSVLAWVGGAGHGTTHQVCAANLAASFLETLKADAGACD